MFTEPVYYMSDEGKIVEDRNIMEPDPAKHMPLPNINRWLAEDLRLLNIEFRREYHKNTTKALAAHDAMKRSGVRNITTK